MEQQTHNAELASERNTTCTLAANQALPAAPEQVMQGEPQIVRLIHLGETEAALRLIRQSTQPDDGDEDAFDPNYKTAGGWSLLHMAALGDAVDVVAALIDAGADLEAEDRGGLRPLHYAVSWDAQQALAELVRRGASLNCTSKDQIFYLNKIIPVFVVGGRTPLHLAVDKGYYECTQMLLEAGADASVIDWSGRTAYDLAVNNNRLDIASLLRPDVTEHVSAVPKNFHFDRRGVETRLGRKAPLPSLHPIPTTTTGDNDSTAAAEPPAASQTDDEDKVAAAAEPIMESGDPRPCAPPTGAAALPFSGSFGSDQASSGGRLGVLADMLRQANALLKEAQRQADEHQPYG